MSDLIDRQAAINAICEDGVQLERHAQYSMTMVERKQRDVDILEALPPVSFENHDEIKSYSKDTISRQQVIDALADMHCKSDEDGYVWIIRSDAWARIDALPSAQPEQHEIGYSECANAMLKMWIDKVLTDGEYNRIMDKLNAYWEERRTDD